jgi:Kef-type K+ transport system membrane component KefB
MSDLEPGSRLFLQLAIILGACRLMGLAAGKFGQPQVIGEILAGVLLGPSLLGRVFPETMAELFPPTSVGVLHLLGQVGLVVYMFLVGLEFQWDVIRSRLRSAAAASMAGILAPFALGSLLTALLLHDDRLFPENISPGEAMLFLGSAMSVTALPVMARILSEQGLTRSSLGTLALAAGSVDDAAAWSFLALVLAVSGGGSSAMTLAVAGGACYTLVILRAGQPLLKRLGSEAERNEGVSSALLALVLILLLLASCVTDLLGIHHVFGAFVLGLSMPRGVLARDLRRHLEPMTTSLLLPLFFAYSGLHTRLGLVDTPFLVAITVLIFVVACLAKGGACCLAAYLQGESFRDALALGTLMNARGLVELILLNIGRERDLITPTLFTIMVLMAIATTLMTTPLLNWMQTRPPDRSDRRSREATLAGLP